MSVIYRHVHLRRNARSTRGPTIRRTRSVAHRDTMSELPDEAMSVSYKHLAALLYVGLAYCFCVSLRSVLIASEMSGENANHDRLIRVRPISTTKRVSFWSYSQCDPEAKPRPAERDGFQHSARTGWRVKLTGGSFWSKYCANSGSVR